MLCALNTMSHKGLRKCFLFYIQKSYPFFIHTNLTDIDDKSHICIKKIATLFRSHSLF